jgi:hypothetical protein
MTFNAQMSLFIPNLGVLNDKDEISRLFHSLDIGRVSYINLFPKQDRLGKSYNSAKIFFAEWYDTDTARALQRKINSATYEKPARMIYDDPLDWILLENRTIKIQKIQGMPGTCIRIAEGLPIPIQFADGVPTYQYESNEEDEHLEDYDEPVQLTRQVTPMINSYLVPEKDYLEIFHKAKGLEKELDEARNENEHLQQDLQQLTEKLDEEHQLQLLIQQEEIVKLETRLFEMETRYRHLEDQMIN